MKKIFLGGGGGALDSVYLDRKFVSEIDKNKYLIYIPVAMKSKPYEECYKWFDSVFSPLGVKKIRMLTDLNDINDEILFESSGIYIGGGSTVKLLKEVRQSGFEDRLSEYIISGKPVYGGSAGAILLGADIRTSPEATNLRATESLGMNILSGYSVYAHYNLSNVKIEEILEKYKIPIIFIPERSGVYIQDEIIECIGFENVHIAAESRIVSLHPKQKLRL
jgi:dipeptidase E